MNNQELSKFSRETRERFLIELNNTDTNSQRHEIIDNVIWALEDLEQYLNNE